jgi:hypothetical protein
MQGFIKKTICLPLSSLSHNYYTIAITIQDNLMTNMSHPAAPTTFLK